jgi:hypothetical protein
MWYSTWYRSKARRQPVFFQQFTDRPAEAGRSLDRGNPNDTTPPGAGNDAPAVHETLNGSLSGHDRHSLNERR